MKHEMQATRVKKQVAVIADSRGARLGLELRLRSNEHVHYRVLVKSGAKLTQLWEIAEHEILYNHPDFIFILGSICDLTDRNYDVFGNRFFWPPMDIKRRVDQVLTTLDEIANNARLICTYTKVCFLPENGMDINKYNGIEDPIPWRNLTTQHELERGFLRLQRKARFINDSMNIVTPRSLDITHSRRNGRMRPVYGRLYNDYVIQFLIEPVYENV